MATAQQFQEYLRLIENPDRCIPIRKLEFLNPDGTVSYAIDNNYKKPQQARTNSRAFLQDGNLNVSLNNGQRRKANIVLENLDTTFDYAINKLWFGNKVRLSMGIKLSDGYDFYISQGVFYFNNPSLKWQPTGRTSSYELVDKWAYLDGTLHGNLESTYFIPQGSNIFSAMTSVLQMSKYTQEQTADKLQMIDPIAPVYTSFYNTRTATVNGSALAMNIVPHNVTTQLGGSYANVLLDLNSLIVGWIGYDNEGVLRVDASQEDLNDAVKPVLWTFKEKGKVFLDFNENDKPSEVYNDIIVWGENTSGNIVGARATNRDAASDTNVGAIGLKTYTESSGNLYSGEQCESQAQWLLKRKTVLQKSVSITSSPLYHLRENNLIAVLRTDKNGNPLERHLIQSYSIPFSTTSPMTITAVSVNDYPQVTSKILDLSQGV